MFRVYTVAAALLAVLTLSPAAWGNVQITSDTGGTQRLDEGDTLNLSGNATGGTIFPDTYHWVIDGNIMLSNAEAPSINWADLKTALGANPDGKYSLTLLVEDGLVGSLGTDTISLFVDNLAPTGTAAGDLNINEGQSFTLTTNSFTDPGGDAMQYQWDMDDDGQFDDDNLTTSTGTLSWAQLQAGLPGDHPNGLNSFKVRVIDTNNTRTGTLGNLATGAFDLSVTIANQDPTGGPGAPLTGANAINEGSDLVLLSPTFADPGGDPLTYEWDLDQDGDFTNDAPNTSTGTVSWANLVTYLPGESDDGDHQIDVRVSDAQGGVSPTGSLDIHILNLAPTGGPGDPLTGANAIDEGTDLNLLNETYMDLGGDTFTYEWDLDNDGDFGDDNLSTSSGTVSWSDLMSLLPDTYPDGAYTIGVRTQDSGNTGVNTAGNKASARAALSIEIANAAPTGGPGDPLTGGDAITEGDALVLLNPTFADPGGDPLSYEWDLDNDGDFTNDAPAATTGEITWADLMTYLAPYPDGGYTIGVRVSDRENASNLTGADQTLDIHVNNLAPTGNAGDDQTIDEGTDLSLLNATYADAGSDALTYHWDLDNDNDFTNDAAPTSAPTVSWAELKAYLPELDAVANTVGVKPEDVDGAEGPADTIEVTITNLTPTADISGALSMDEGQPLVLDAGGSSDPGDDDLVYAWELDGDDSFDDVVTSTPTFARVVQWSSLLAFGFHVGNDNEIKLRVTDAGNNANLSDEAVAYVTVNNTAPTAEDDAFIGDEDTALTIAAPGLVDNDSDPSGNTPTVVGGSTTGITLPPDALVDAPLATVRGATATLRADGGFTYDPAGVTEFQALGHGESLIDTFNYFIQDAHSATDYAEVTITVEGVNDPPAAVDDDVTVLEDTPGTLSVLDNDSDPEGPFVSPTAVLEVLTPPLHGTLGLDAASLVFTYAPYGDYSGPDSFVYRIIDGGTPVLFDSATVNITVEPVNDPPDAVDDFVVGNPDGTPSVIDVLANDSDLESPQLDAASLTIVTPVDPASGTAEVQPDGTVLFTPDPAFQGLARFVYRVFDFGQGTSPPRSADAEVLIAVNLDDLEVDNLGDGVDFDISAGKLTLREATVLVEEAGIIGFDPIIFAAGQTIQLDPEQGAIELGRAMTIARGDAGGVTVNGDGETRIFDVRTTNVVIDGLTLTNGGPATGDGGAVLVRAGSQLLLRNSTVKQSHAPAGFNGGGIHNAGDLRLHNVTLRANSAVLGGGLHNVGTATATNLTAFENVAEGDGGGIYNAVGTLELIGATCVGNTAAAGGALAKQSGEVYVANALLIGNTALAGSGTDVQGPAFESNGHNLVGDPDGGSGWLETDLLGYARNQVVDSRLRNNGGQMLTLALLPHSPAIDAGDNAETGVDRYGLNPVDQRGTGTDANGVSFPRVAGGTVDIGAYETQPWTVGTNADEDDLGPAGGALPLRKALRIAHAGDTITLDIAGQITIDPALGALVANAGVGVVGPGADSLALDGAGVTQVFYVQDPLSVVSLTGLTLTGGYDDTGLRGIGGPAVYNWGEIRLTACRVSGNTAAGLDGGAILNRGTLSLTACMVEGNSAGHVGGAVNNRGGAVTIMDSAFSGNAAGRVAGALANMLGGTASVVNSHLAGNSAGEAGAIRNGMTSSLTVLNSTLEANAAVSHGGGISNLGALTITNSTLSANVAGQSGGGLYHGSGQASLASCTLTLNQADLNNAGFANGGGIFRKEGGVRLVNTIVAGNFDTPANLGVGNIHPDLSGGATDLGNNLIGVSDGAPGFQNGVNGGQVGTISHPLDPMLGPLGDYGGPTPTHTPMVQSPVIDAGNGDAIATPPFPAEPFTDQRADGFDRLVDGDGDGETLVDIGAVEFHTTAPTFTSTPVETATEDQLYVYVITTDDVDLDETFSVTAPTIPSWLSLADILREAGGSVTLQIPDPVDTGRPITWRKDQALLDTNGQTTTLVLENLNIADSGAYTAEYHDGENDRTYGPVNLEVVEPGVLPIPGVLDPDNVQLTPILSGRPTNEDIGAPFTQATHEVVLQVEDWAHAVTLQSFNVVIAGVNDPPLVANDRIQTYEDRAIVISVVNNDTDVDGLIDPATVSIVSDAANGSLSVHPTQGKVTYTPNANFNGEDSFTYQVFDTGAPNPPEASTAQVTVTVVAQNDPPVATNDTASLDEDTSVTIDVLANDYDVDGNIRPALVLVPVQPPNGVTSVNTETGAITYTPDPNFEGVETFTYRIFDDGSPLPVAHAEGQVTVTVNGVNDVPTARDDSAITNEDQAVTFSVLGNDTDIDGQIDPATLTVISPVQHGALDIDPVTGAVTYTPLPDYEGTDGFTYAISDNGSPLPAETDTASVTITVVALNDPPVPQDDSGSTLEDRPVTIDVLANDSDVDGELLPGTVVVTSPPLNGSTTVDAATGKITYTPHADSNGWDSFQYRVTDSGTPEPGKSAVANVGVLVVAQNDAPRTQDDAATMDEDSVITIDVLANDTDVDGELAPASVIVTVPPAHGVTEVNPATGAITYTPGHDVFGPDSFTYRVTDDGDPLPAKSATAVVNITIRQFSDEVIEVNTLLDQNQSVYSPQDISLREAIAMLSPGGTITFAPGLAGVIELSPVYGELVIDKTLTIEGPGANVITVDGGLDVRVLNVADEDGIPNTLVDITGLTFAGGDPRNGTSGGVLRTTERLSLYECVVAEGNAAAGGGIYNEGALFLERCTLWGNYALEGGGIMNTGSCTLVNTTLSGNTSTDAGAALFHDSPQPAVLLNCTATLNLANDDNVSNGAGAALYTAPDAEPIDLRNCLAVGNWDTPDNAGPGSIHPDVAGAFAGAPEGQSNLIGSMAGATGFGETDLTLGDGDCDGPCEAGDVLDLVLAYNGGTVPTHALVPGSMAISHGNNAFVTAGDMAGPPYTDARGPGYPRLLDGMVDAGAYEAQDFCAYAFAITERYDAFRTAFGVEDDDLDGDGLPESFVVPLWSYVYCAYDDSELQDATRAAYLLNLQSLGEEADGPLVGEHWQILSILFGIGQHLQNEVMDILANAGIHLTGTYYVVNCNTETGDCTPDLTGGSAVDAKLLVEPYGGSGDIDGDGYSNRWEYENILERDGTVQDFIQAVLDDRLDGSQSRAGCQAGDARPGRAPWGDVALVLMLVAVLLAPRISARTTRR